MHGANLFSGSPLATVLPQVMSAFLMGTLLYLTRRVTGGLVIPILVHAVWDFSLFSHGTSKAEVVPGAGLLVQGSQPTLVVILFVVAIIAHKEWMDSKDPQLAT